jgi:hypothetical protein
LRKSRKEDPWACNCGMDERGRALSPLLDGYIPGKQISYLFIYYYKLKQTSLDKLIFSLDFLKKEKLGLDSASMFQNNIFSKYQPLMVFKVI